MLTNIKTFIVGIAALGGISAALLRSAALPLIMKHIDILSCIATLGGISMLSGIAAHSFLAALPRPAPLITHSGIAALGGVIAALPPASCMCCSRLSFGGGVRLAFIAMAFSS